MRVLTLTLNPAIDQSVRVTHLVRGEVHRALASHQNAAGKGINVAGCLADQKLDVTLTVTGLLGQENAALFEAFFAAKDIEDRFVRVDGSTRVNIKISDDGETTDINLPGLIAPETALNQVRAELGRLSAGDIAILSGSLPPDCPPDIYAELARTLRDRGVMVVADTSGRPLDLLLTAPVLPHVLKPNIAELSEALGRTLETDAAVIEAAHDLIRRGAEYVVVSQGARGALFVTQNEVVRAHFKVARVVSTVGAGDALVAGFVTALLARPRLALEQMARLATAFAGASLTTEGANLPPLGVHQRLAERVVTDFIIKEQAGDERQVVK